MRNWPCCPPQISSVCHFVCFVSVLGCRRVECTEVIQKRILDGFRELAFARSYFTITQHWRALDPPELRSTEGNVGLPFVPLPLYVLPHTLRDSGPNLFADDH
jgi:hypothetical protein